MILPLTLAILFEQDKSPLDFIVPERTGRNGYEEFVGAAKLIQGTPLAAIENQPKIGDRDWLERRRQMVAQSSKALDLVHAGLTKPVSYPSVITPATLLPELSLFKRLATGFAYRCSVMCADGNPEGAAEAVADGFRFARAVMATGGDIHYLVGHSMSWIMFAEFDRSKQVFTKRGLERIATSLEGADQTTPMANIQTAAAGLSRHCDVLLSKPDDVLKLAGDKDRAGSWKRLTLQEQTSRIETYKTAWANGLSVLGRVFQSPENTWAASVPEELPVDLPYLPVVWENDDTEILLNGDLVTLSATFRSCVRLVRLHCEVLKRRWTFGALPPTLDSLTVDARNPQTGELFHYQLQGKSYQLWTTDLSGEGRLDLIRSTPQNGLKGQEPPQVTR